MLLGISLQLMVGPEQPVPAPAPLAEALAGVEVTLSDEGRSGFQLTFQAGRSGPTDLVDYPLLLNPLLRPFNRVLLTVVFNAVPRVLMDGFITRTQLAPSEEPGASTFTVTGEDVSVIMDLVENKIPHPAMAEPVIVATLLARYTQYLLAPPVVVPPRTVDSPPPTESIPTQGAKTDLAYLTELAGRFGHVFHVTPGPLPRQNVAYWGPPQRIGLPQPALSVNMGPESNVDSISFSYDAMAPTTVVDVVQDSRTGLPMPVFALFSSRLPPLAAFPAPAADLLAHHRVSTLNLPEQAEGAAPTSRGGMTWEQAMALAQSKVDASVDKVVTATGELDALRYGNLLTPRGLVGLRGAGFSYDGTYYVKSVTHSIKLGAYKQRFTLTREGVGSTTPLVRP
jgi:hypothetical protein